MPSLDNSIKIGAMLAMQLVIYEVQNRHAEEQRTL